MLIVNKYKTLLASLAVFFCLQFSFAIATSQSWFNARDGLVQQIESRIAKDLSRLPLPNKSKTSVGNEDAIAHYIERINDQIKAQPIEAKLIAIQSEKFNAEEEQSLWTSYFTTPSQTIYFAMVFEKPVFFDYVSLLSCLISGLFFVALSVRKKQVHVKRASVLDLSDNEKAHLVIDLEQKLLINSKTHAQASLANKPLCFYTALIEYCADNPDVLLNQNKVVPEELITLANKYFYRLTELGHTIRKRPNFSNNLEKTLSEIRASLDEILQDELVLKDQLFPPKAHGEGSRSKLHNYGLKLKNLEAVEIIGK